MKADRVARYAALIEAESATLEEMAQRVAEGETLAEVCAAWDVPYGRVRAWISADPRRLELYQAAQSFYADALAMETIAIADGGGGDTAHAALRNRARQWLAGKLDRARYGDSVVVQHQGETVVRLTFGGGMAGVGEQPALVGSSSAVDIGEDPREGEI